MRLVVMSDSHRNLKAVLQVVKKHSSDADLFLHLGDGVEEIQKTAQLYARHQFLWVRGNCDFGSDAPEDGSFMVEGKTVFYTHGHLYGVKQDLDALCYIAGKKQATLALYGHTHRADIEYRAGLYLINPGSLSSYEPGYAVVEITRAGISPALLLLH